MCTSRVYKGTFPNITKNQFFVNNMKQFLRNDNVHYIPSTIRFVKIILGGGYFALALICGLQSRWEGG